MRSTLAPPLRSGTPRPVDHAARAAVAALRAELAAIEPERACCRAAERVGLGHAAMGRARDPVVARLVVRLGQADGSDRFRWSSAADHCRLAWLRGRFLARGSLSLAGGRTHLEFVLPPDDAAVLADALAALDLPARRSVRRGRGVLTWKSAATVHHFLRLVGASSTLLELEARTVSRELRGDLNRQLNAETANLRRGIASSARQVEAIATLRAHGRDRALSGLDRRVATARSSAPDASLTELAAELGIGRSTIQRALERIEAEAARVR